jgi:recombination protein RecA
VVGDKSVGKTLLAIEACANFARRYPKGKIWYRESEAAFDEKYAVQLGLPVDRVDFGPEGIGTEWETVEDVIDDLGQKVEKARGKREPGLYIVDTLDALSDRAEQARDVGEGSYGMAKAKLMSALFRRCVRPVKRTNVHLMFISQIRDKIGVTFGEKKTRTGGHALDFYASQILWLSHLKTLTREIRGMKLSTAIRVLAKCKKNKISVPNRQCEFTVRFGYGVEDIEASVDWLAHAKLLDRIGLSPAELPDYKSDLADLSQVEYLERADTIRNVILGSWEEVEADIRPKRQKYA